MEKKDPLNYTSSVKYYCKIRESIALIFMDIWEERACRHSMWMQLFLSSPISTLLHSLLHIYNSYILPSTLNS